jgi:hypothetical protein
VPGDEVQRRADFVRELGRELARRREPLELAELPLDLEELDVGLGELLVALGDLRGRLLNALLQLSRVRSALVGQLA